ncbi:MAG: XTP/dITP diphosphatase [Clostridia bacterium]|nr:XTP/dITP diphosphatase [Clostridia bacterium]
MKLVIASNNANKIREIKEILGGFFEEVFTLKDLGLDIEVEETGETFEENALIKAREISRVTGLPALADDSGLCVDCLDGAPGVYSARYAGPGHVDAENNALLLKNMSDKTDRKASFSTVIALVYPDGKYLTVEGKTYGEILHAPEGKSGFGYDPLFFSYDLNKSFGLATPEEKNAVSHRGRALRALEEILQKG